MSKLGRIRWLRIQVGRLLFGWGLSLLRPEIERTWDELASQLIEEGKNFLPTDGGEDEK